MTHWVNAFHHFTLNGDTELDLLCVNAQSTNWPINEEEREFVCNKMKSRIHTR